MENRTYQFGKSTLTIRFGDITTSEAEVIVNSDDAFITMGGGVSGSILRAGGQEIIIDAAKKVPARVGDVIVTTAGRLHAKYVFHAITIGSGEDKAPAQEVLRGAVSRCFDLLDVLGLSSVAFPAIGAGAARFNHKDVAVEMANIIADRLLESQSQIDVTVFLFDRFRRMQPIDYIDFFEEFRARVPRAGREVSPESRSPGAPVGPKEDRNASRAYSSTS